MPIKFDKPTRRIRHVVRFKGSLGENTTNWITWWYCGIVKNTAANTQPLVLIGFREVGSKGLSDEVILRRVPLTALGQFRIGSIWKGGLCRSEAVFQIETFDVTFSKEGWRLVSFSDAKYRGDSAPYPFGIHPLAFSADKNWMIEFDLQSGGKLLIPCLEFLARCYGRSAELKRVLATYPWCGPTEVHNSRLYAPLEEKEEPEKWKVRLRRRMVNGDVVFLAHAKYDPNVLFHGIHRNTSGRNTRL